ncbi:MAG TPA: hypothetical protein PK390_01720 [Fervidobacterium nodosum]|nr:hypothetical protein [Fervidobacterium nodosum]
MVGDNQFEEIAGLPSVRAILHKTYFYTAMSHEPRFSGKSLLAIQVSTQLEAFQTQMITSVLR